MTERSSPGSDLLPCPFCGKQPRSDWNGADGPHDDNGYWAIECCGAFVHEDDEETARKLWNTRAPAQAAQSSAVNEVELRNDLGKTLDILRGPNYPGGSAIMAIADAFSMIEVIISKLPDEQARCSRCGGIVDIDTIGQTSHDVYGCPARLSADTASPQAAPQESGVHAGGGNGTFDCVDRSDEGKPDAQPQAAPMRDAVEHALTRFECLEDHFKEAGDEALWAMSSVDADRMRKAIDQDQAISPAQPQADRETDWRLRALRAEAEIDRLLTQPQAASEYASWTDEDYQRARDCMLGILRQKAWTITKDRDEKEFDNAFQHAVGILSLTARQATQPQAAWTSDDIERATKAMYDAEWGHGAWEVAADSDKIQRRAQLHAGLAALTRPLREMTDGDGK